MKKIKVILITGKAGSGKDTIVNRLTLTDDRFYRVVSTTTRPKRSGEIQDKDYHFCSEEEFETYNMIDPGNFRGWRYGTSIESLRENKINLIITDPTRIDKFLTNSALDILNVFYFERPDVDRLISQLKRENNPDIDEIYRRYKADSMDFDGFSKRSCVTTLDNTLWEQLMKNISYIQGLEWLNEQT